MSKKVPQKEYERTLSYHLKEWLNGSKEILLDNVEMKPQKPFEEDKELLVERKKEEQQRFEKVYDLKSNREVRFFRKAYRVLSVLFCLFLVLMLLIAVSNLPSFGDASNPVNNEVSKRYIENGLQETGSVNIVTGMILDYRAFDTLGESNVLFCATITVLILLQITDKKKKKTDEDMIFEPHDDPILKLSAKVLVPVIMIFGVYVVLNGHLSPGGGFSGGAIIGAGLILYQNAFGFSKAKLIFNEKTYKSISACALLTYCLCKTYSFFTGANHLDSHIPLGIPGHILSSGLILILNICVGMVVACTMYTFYVMFRKGDF